MPASFFLDGPAKAEIDEAIALARAWAILFTDPASMVEGEDYSSKQWAKWSQQYAIDAAAARDAAVAARDEILGYGGAYTPADGSNWDTSTNGPVVPTTVAQALDLLAAQIYNLDNRQGSAIILPICGEDVVITVGMKAVFRPPIPFLMSGVRASLTVAQVGGTALALDVKLNGVTTLSGPRSFVNGQKEATAGGVVTVPFLPNTGEVVVEVTAVGDGTAKGLDAYLVGCTYPPFS